MWLIVGLIIGALVIGLLVLLNKKNWTLKWYEWVIGAVGIILVLFAFQNFFGFIAENEPAKGAWIFLLIVMVPALILLALACWLPYMRIKNGSVGV